MYRYRLFFTVTYRLLRMLYIFCRNSLNSFLKEQAILSSLAAWSFFLRAQHARADWVLHVGDKADVEKAGNSLLQRLHPGNKLLFLDY